MDDLKPIVRELDEAIERGGTKDELLLLIYTALKLIAGRDERLDETDDEDVPAPDVKRSTDRQPSGHGRRLATRMAQKT